MQAYYRGLQNSLVRHFQVGEDVPFQDLPENFKQALYFGTGDQPIEMSFGGNGRMATKTARPFEGLLPQLQRLYLETQSELTRSRIRAFMNRAPCSVCHGARLKPSTTRAFVVPLSEPSIVQLARDERRIIDETPDDAAKRLALTLDDAARPTAAPILKRGEVAYVLVVGDPLQGDHDDTINDLEVLAEAMSPAVERM